MPKSQEKKTLLREGTLSNFTFWSSNDDQEGQCKNQLCVQSAKEKADFKQVKDINKSREGSYRIQSTYFLLWW